MSAGKRDRITDFTAGSDKIDLSGIDAAATRIGDQEFHGLAGELHYQANAGDVDGDKAADFQIIVLDATSLTAGDFLL